MPVSKSSKASPASKSRARQPERKSSRAANSSGADFGWASLVLPFVVLCALGLAAAWFVSNQGWTLYYGDAEAHLNIARRIIDSRTPGPEQIGTVWLPLPHLAMIPFVSRDAWWQSGIAGAFVNIPAFIAAGLFLFAAARKAFANSAAGWAALLLFATNANALYMAAIPMTESLMFLGLAAQLWGLVEFARSRSWLSVAVAALGSIIATQTRYEGWFLIPFLSLFLFILGGERRWPAAIGFTLVAMLSPLSWLAHNAYYFSNPLEFYNGPYSAKAIYQRSLDAGVARYPGDHDLKLAAIYFVSAVRHCAGWVLSIAGMTGLAIALLRRVWWPILFLALPVLFYVWSLYWSGTPIYVPDLWPNSYYNTRYGLAALLLLCFSAAAWVSILLRPAATAGTALLVLAAGIPSLFHPAITWKESEVNSIDRRAWTAEIAAILKQNYRPGDGILTSFGDLTGIYREAGIPLREILHEGNIPYWDMAVARPQVAAYEEWAITEAAKPVATAVQQRGAPYKRVKILTSGNSPVIEIYRRNAYSLHESARSQE